MSDINDEIVDRMLHGLRDAAPPDGMESRIVGALHHRAAAGLSRRRACAAFVPWTGSAVLAGVVCALLFTAHRKAPPVMVAHSTAISMQAKSGAIPQPTHALRMPARPVARGPRMASAPPPPKEAWLVVSYPAPPMPLTDQEKLLLRLAHKGDPVQLAMLDPARRNLQNAAEKAQFQQFFEPSTLGDPQ